MGFALKFVLLLTLSSASAEFQWHLIEFAEVLKQGRCSEDVAYILENYKNRERQALEVLDSWANNLPSGILFGNTVDFGNYDQCLGAAIERTGGEVIEGQHCTISFEVEYPAVETNEAGRKRFKHYEWISFEVLPTNVQKHSDNISISLGVCFPASCSPAEIYEASKKVLGSHHKIAILSYDQKEFCSTKHTFSQPFSVLDIATISFFGFFVLCMLASTLYELWQLKHGRQGHPILRLFSVYKNGRKILTSHTYRSPEGLYCINGIRVISLMWIIFAHSYMMLIMNPLVNKRDLENWVSRYQSMIVLGSSVAVDSFFLLSGTLVCWVILKTLNSGSPLNIPKIYVHRYLRLTPAFAALLLLTVSLFTRLGNGPLWMKASESLAGPCRQYWWSALLFSQNYLNPKDMCLGHSWYLSVDMQLFLLAPFIVWPLYKWRNRMLIVVVALIGTSIGFAFAASYKNDLRVSALINVVNGTNLQKGELLYYPTHIRMGVWLAGVLLGYSLFSTKGKRIFMSRSTVAAGWLLTLATCSSIVFGIFQFQQETYEGPIFIDATYESVIRVSWGMAISWLIFACVHGYGGIVNDVLSFRVWKPLSKLSYSAYLLHYPLQIAIMSGMRAPKYFSDFGAIHKFWGDFMITMCAAVFWMLAFEMPIVEVEEFLLKKEQEENLLGEAVLN